MRGIGTVINVFTIVGGTLVGLIVGRYISERIRLTVEQAVGMTTLVLGIATAAKTDNIVFPLVSVVLGGIIGELLRVEERFETLGNWVRRKVEVKTQTGWLSRSSLTTLHPRFVEGFVTASLLFVIGPLAILGSVSDGMSQGIDQLILKSSLDFFAAMAFASTLGWGVAASAIPVAIYQGFWTIIGLAAGSVLSQYQIDAMTICGGLMLVGISLRLLDIKRIPVANLLPALVIAPALATVLHLFK